MDGTTSSGPRWTRGSNLTKWTELPPSNSVPMKPVCAHANTMARNSDTRAENDWGTYDRLPVDKQKGWDRKASARNRKSLAFWVNYFKYRFSRKHRTKYNDDCFADRFLSISKNPQKCSPLFSSGYFPSKSFPNQTSRIKFTEMYNPHSIRWVYLAYTSWSH